MNSFEALEIAEDLQNFFVRSCFQKKITSLFEATDNLKVLERIQNLFEYVLNNISNKFISAQPFVKQEASHSKKVLYSTSRHQYNLNIEWIRFHGNYSTGVHTHPEFLAEQILLGSLRELTFQEKEAKYLLENTVVRAQGEFRLQYCENGFPHDVIAVDSPCEVLCISFGKNMPASIDKRLLHANS